MEPGNLAQWASVIVSSAVAALAIWGDLIRSRLAGPRLEIDVSSPDGEKTEYNATGKPARYYHLKVTNRRSWSPAKNVRVVLVGLARPAADGSYSEVQLSSPLQLHWQYPTKSPQYAQVGPPHTSDLGHIEQDSGFTLSLYVTPMSFKGAVGKNERIRVEVRALADNGESPSLFVEVAWNGSWSEDTLEMRTHLAVKQVGSLAGP
jgi:hypothetical protein